GINNGPLLFDEVGNLFGSEFDSKSLLFVSRNDLARAIGTGGPLHPETYSPTEDGIASRMFAVLEDREKNIWVGTTNALHRFSRSKGVRAARGGGRQYGVSTGAAFAPGDDGELWLACGGAVEAYVDKLRDGVLEKRQQTPPFSVAYRDTDGVVWFAGAA